MIDDADKALRMHKDTAGFFAHALNCNDPDGAFEACWRVAGSNAWAARHHTWLLIKLTPKCIVFSFLFFAGSSDVLRQEGGGRLRLR